MLIERMHNYVMCLGEKKEGKKLNWIVFGYMLFGDRILLLNKGKNY